jgi:hypothetical protein
LNALDLDGDDRQDLHGDTVELVEAAPRAWLGQAFVDVAYRLEEEITNHLIWNKTLIIFLIYLYTLMTSIFTWWESTTLWLILPEPTA